MSELNLKRDASDYLEEHSVHALFESLCAQLIIHRPDDPKDFLRELLNGPVDGIDALRLKKLEDLPPLMKERVAKDKEAQLDKYKLKCEQLERDLARLGRKPKHAVSKQLVAEVITEADSGPSRNKEVRHYDVLLGNRLMVLDAFGVEDVLGTTSEFANGAPNFRGIAKMPVYGMGQPTRDGLRAVTKHLMVKGHSHVISVNLREEPITFMHGVSYSPRDPDQLMLNLALRGIEADELEVDEERLKSEILARSQGNNGKFPVYHNVIDMSKEPRIVSLSSNTVKTLRDVCHGISNEGLSLQYARIPITDECAPEEKDFDDLVDIFKDADPKAALVFSCHIGLGRTSTAMCVAAIMWSNRHGFPDSIEEHFIDHQNPNFKLGEYKAIRELCQELPMGLKRKAEVDFILDECYASMSKMNYHIREIICETEKSMNDAVRKEDKIGFLLKGIDFIERYFYLILFNAYAHEHHSSSYEISFCQWMKINPHYYRILDNNMGFDRRNTIDLTKTNLVRDIFKGMDKLGSLSRIEGVPNYRKVDQFPVYGIGQPTIKGVHNILRRLLYEKKHPHIYWVSLREEPTVIINGESFSVRAPTRMLFNLKMTGIQAEELEDIEASLVQDIVTRASQFDNCIPTYHDVINTQHEPHIEEIRSGQVKTIDTIFKEIMSDGTKVTYSRIPITGESAPEEGDFEEMVDLLKDANLDAALVFNSHCGRGRVTTAMVIASLMFCVKKGHPYTGKPAPINPLNPDYKMGEYKAVQDLVALLPNGLKVKKEVDETIDRCSHMVNLRLIISESVENAKSEETGDAKMFWSNRALNMLERYFYLICFNAYLHEEVKTNFKTGFGQWLRKRTELYELLDSLSVDDKDATMDLEKNVTNIRWRWRTKRKAVDQLL